MKIAYIFIQPIQETIILYTTIREKYTSESGRTLAKVAANKVLDTSFLPINISMKDSFSSTKNMEKG